MHYSFRVGICSFLFTFYYYFLCSIFDWSSGVVVKNRLCECLCHLSISCPYLVNRFPADTDGVLSHSIWFSVVIVVHFVDCIDAHSSAWSCFNIFPVYKAIIPCHEFFSSPLQLIPCFSK